VNLIAAMEKDSTYINESPDYTGQGRTTYVDPATGVETKTGRIIEAGELYGNIETAEEYGYVTRGYVEPLSIIEL
jgi:amino acid transporter